MRNMWGSKDFIPVEDPTCESLRPCWDCATRLRPELVEQGACLELCGSVRTLNPPLYTTLDVENELRSLTICVTHMTSAPCSPPLQVEFLFGRQHRREHEPDVVR